MNSRASITSHHNIHTYLLTEYHIHRLSRYYREINQGSESIKNELMIMMSPPPRYLFLHVSLLLLLVLLSIQQDYVSALSSTGAVASNKTTSSASAGAGAGSGTAKGPTGDIGIAMAGGSFRAASTCFGVLRGFQQKKVLVIGPNGEKEEVPAMDLVKYNSGISGGSFPAILYTYAQVTSSDELLETHRTVDPALITSELLNHMPESSMGRSFTKINVNRAIFTTLKSSVRVSNFFRVHSLWTGVIYKKIFEHLNVPKNKFFTSGKEELDQILRENPKLKANDFLLPRDDVKTMPMILFSSSGSRFDGNKYMDNYQHIYQEAWKDYKAQETLEFFTNTGNRPNMTEFVLRARDEIDEEMGIDCGANLPMAYVATPSSVENKYTGLVKVQDKMIEFPEKPTRPFEWGVNEGGIAFGSKRRFSVEYLNSLSTNFLGMLWQKIPITSQVFANLRKIKLSDGSAVTQKFIDGGMNDLMGIVPLVSSGMKDIIAVYNLNQNTPYMTNDNTYADIYKVANATSLDDPDFDSHFQRWVKMINPRITCYFGFFNVIPINHANIMNHIFLDPNIDRLKELMVKMNSLFKAGEPLVVTLKDLETVENPFWGIKAGNTVNLTLMYYTLPKKFSDKVPIEAVPPPEGLPKVDDDGRFTNEEFKVIPELPGGSKQASYSNAQVSMMGYLGSWIVHHSWDGLKGADGEVVFDGFKDIFEKS